MTEAAEQTEREPWWLNRPRFAGDPVTFLTAFLTMMRHPHRAEIGFDHEDLQWLADVWEQAGIVSHGDEEFLREHRKFQKFCDDLKQGIVENGGEVGITFLETHDWPKARTIIRAARLLGQHEIRGIYKGVAH